MSNQPSACVWLLFLIFFSEWFYCAENKKKDMKFRVEWNTQSTISACLNSVHNIYFRWMQIRDSEKALFWVICVYRVRVFIRFDIVCSLSVLIGSCSDMSSWNKIDSHRHWNKKISQLKTSAEIRSRCECTQTVECLGTWWRFRHMHTDMDADECTQIHSCMNSWLMSQWLPGWLLLRRLMLGFSPEKVPSSVGPLTS